MAVAQGGVADERLRIFLFGNAGIQYPRTNFVKVLSSGQQSLLAYLLLQRNRHHSRELLADRLWDGRGVQDAKRALNTALWRLRRDLKPAESAIGAKYLLTNNVGDIRFNTECPYWLDVEEFERGITRLLDCPTEDIAAAEIDILEKSVSVVTGHLLENNFQDWAIFERERLIDLHIRARRKLMQSYALTEFHERGLAHGQAILAEDPLREDVHRDMMRLYAASGNRSGAIQQYLSCKALLDKELAVEPMIETQRLFRAVADQTPPGRRATADTEIVAEDGLTLKLMRHLSVMEQFVDRLRRHIDATERALETTRRFPED